MISNWLSAALARRNIHYGWVMVGVTFLTALISAGTVGAPGVFIVPLQKEFGWTTAEISSALSIRFILFGLMAPFAAALLNRYGLRNVTLSALLVVASGLLMSQPVAVQQGGRERRHQPEQNKTDRQRRGNLRGGPAELFLQRHDEHAGRADRAGADQRGKKGHTDHHPAVVDVAAGEGG